MDDYLRGQALNFMQQADGKDRKLMENLLMVLDHQKALIESYSNSFRDKDSKIESLEIKVHNLRRHIK
jgi:hypothetical protein